MAQQSTIPAAPANADDEPVNVAERQGLEICKGAVACLPTVFDGDAGNLRVFLSELGDQGLLFDWRSILDIPVNPDGQERATSNLLTSYGTISLEKIISHSRTYITGATRNAQNAQWMYHCIMGSISKEVKNRIILQSSSYFVDRKPSGPALLKVIIQETSVDTNASVCHIRDRLSNLDVYMHRVKSDINAFNIYVRSLLDSLNARGEMTCDLLSNLFKGYKAASDTTFLSYVQRKEEQYDDGATLTPEQLMHDARNKYASLSSEGKWNALSRSDTKLVALQAEVSKLRASGGQKRKASNDHHATRTVSYTAVSSGGKKGRASHNRTWFRTPEEWMRAPPRDGEAKTKSVNNRLFHWCHYHKMWVQHHPKDCRLSDSRSGNKKGNYQSGPEPGLKLSKALADLAVANGSEL